MTFTAHNGIARPGQGHCKDFQNVPHQYSLYSSKACGSECCLSYSPIGDTRISDAAARWVDLALSHSIYHCSQCLLSLSPMTLS